jgi:hypothetical protein
MLSYAWNCTCFHTSNAAFKLVVPSVVFSIKGEATCLHGAPLYTRRHLSACVVYGGGPLNRFNQRYLHLATPYRFPCIMLRGQLESGAAELLQIPSKTGMAHNNTRTAY